MSVSVHPEFSNEQNIVEKKKIVTQKSTIKAELLFFPDFGVQLVISA